ncbi:YcaO-like family protein [Pseudomonas sp. MYb118]|uniref:YcaO-like family protein n=1 Tax=Pseudomonas sp. MYb118 TaxID=1848720 RepID=UPI0034CFF073
MDGFTCAERELPLEQATQRIEAEWQRLGLCAQSQQWGQRVVAIHVRASDHEGRIIARGSGKGYPPCAHVGALYETLEHHLSDHVSPDDICWVTSCYFANSRLFIDDSVLSPLIEQPHALTACRTYTDYLNHTTFHYPVALCSPHYSLAPLKQDTTDYNVLKRYASNSGTAIGATYHEAVLHAVNECIERDAVALFLLDHFYYRTPSTLRRVARPTADDALGRLWRDAEVEIGADIVVIDISNEFLPHTFLACSTQAGSQPRVFGSGCSLSARHGAWRAVTELVQLHHGLTQPEQQYHLSNAKKHLSPFPRLLRCLQFDVHVLLARCEQLTVELPDEGPTRPLADQIDRLAADLHRHGRTLGITRLHETPLGTTLVNVVIPGLERFFVVSSGNVVVPQARGRRLRVSQGVPA